MAHLLARIIGMLGAGALVVGCSSGVAAPDVPGPATGPGAGAGAGADAWPRNAALVVDEPPSVWWDMSTTRTLAPTGIEILVAPGADTHTSASNLAVEGMVVDGTGAVWIHSPWRLFRVDPRTGQASTWDIGDDLAFGTVASVRPSASAGVWLLYEDHVALFDGYRFVRELVVPHAYRGDDPIRDLIEVDSDVWVSSPAGVARYTSDGWSMVASDRLVSAASLALGPDGQVWASGRREIRNGTLRGVVRFDGQTWQPIGGPVPMRPQEEFIANVAGGLAYAIGNGVYWSDDTEWQTLAWDNTDWGAVRSLAVTEDGQMWLQREGGVARWEAASGWEAVGPASAGWDDVTIQALAADGNEVFGVGARGLLRIDGVELIPVWAPVRVGPRTDWHPPVDEEISREARPEQSLGHVRAVSSDELWLASGSSLFRYHEGQWGAEWRMGPEWGSLGWALPLEARSTKLALATDGSVWTSTPKGMVRFVRGERRVVVEGPAYGLTTAGPDGAVWVVEPGEFVLGTTIREPGDDITLIGPEGTRRSVPLPIGANAMTSVHCGLSDFDRGRVVHAAFLTVAARRIRAR